MLRTDNRGVARAFAQGHEARNSNGQFYCERDRDGRLVLYSYGPHWPVACWNDDGTVTVNLDKRSPTTSKHTTFARSGLARECYTTSSGMVRYVGDTAEMCRIVRGHAL